MICENCGKTHNGSFGSGRFCCKSCSISFGNKNRSKTNETKQKISKSIKDYYNKQSYELTCKKCSKQFKTIKYQAYCQDCKKQNTKDINNISSILELSKRTVSKIIKRANLGCTICNWNLSTCDIHHIIPKKVGGTDEMSNLILVCPNCHRVIHNENLYTYDYLKTRSLDIIFNDWKLYYNVKK